MQKIEEKKLLSITDELKKLSDIELIEISENIQLPYNEHSEIVKFICNECFGIADEFHSYCLNKYLLIEIIDRFKKIK